MVFDREIEALSLELADAAEGVDRLAARILKHLEDVKSRERERCARIAEAFLHCVPDEGGDALDETARYSNGTCRRIAAAIRAGEDGE